MSLFLEQILIAVIKALVVIGFVLGLASLNTWFERKVSALIQHRTGANRAAIFGFDLAGIINTLVCDPVKAFLKEDWLPKGVSQFMHSLAPFLAVFPVIISMAVIPFGPSVSIGGNEIALQVSTTLDSALLYVFAMGSLAVYGMVLAGWVSNNKFSLLGGLRATAQMISYEVTMGISVVPLLMIYGTADLSEIVQAQGGTWFGLPAWGIFLNPIAFFVFFTAAMAETKRAPFDLPEAESELVAGYMTEYSGMKFLLFWLGEFAEIVVCASLLTVIFLGGWQVPYLDITLIPADWWGILPDWFNQQNFQWAPIIGFLVFGFKVTVLCVLQVIIRWTLPRFRYDQLMSLCWKLLLTVSILNVAISAILVLKGVYLR